MTVIKVEGMHCETCVQRIEKGMEKAEVKCKVSLAEKTVEVEGCDQCVKTAIDVLDDLGFEGIAE